MNSFNKGFNSVYYAKVHCPVCKEKIFANSLKCPNCLTDFTKPPYNKHTSWQSGAMKIVLIISAFIGIAICFSGAPILLGIFVGLALYGGGYVAVQKIQSFRNFNNRK
ncbi:MAG: hypothetical protein WCG45_03990 [bacterium]